ncbi:MULTISPECIES: gamma carbonic anhydrase family protein [unclassified Sedimentibacter]|uniref:gamma carbonic anhydrase family protein n=1 Tax=unclassified Sedimentibacter TaxID=2649220 RepID=UPI0027E142A4|nr:gamma carbonic anhydrase family protein [Sedimentibacter sp. MB35-C1]WMJ78848.1 gamma carbonic anhydrase family protein [Sedimentibacter sp. MB35-C1]
MIKEFEGILPIIDEKTYVAEGAQLIGNVIMKEYSSVWYNAVARGDINTITIGRYTNIQDNAIVHVDDTEPTVIGDFVTVGHGANVHGCTIEDHCLIGMGAIILNGAVIGRGSIIAAGAVVKEHEIIPPFSMVAGVPGKIIKKLPENTDRLHAQAVKYKTLWSIRYGVMPEAGGEIYNGEQIV